MATKNKKAKASKSVGKASKPVGKASKSVGKASKPVGKASKSVGEASKSVGKASKSAGKASKSAGKASKSAGKAKRKEIRLRVGERQFGVELLIPATFERAIITANGAGASMDSEFITSYHDRLAREGLLSVKFNFPYQEQGRSAPDRRDVLLAAYTSVVEHLVAKLGVPLEAITAGGKSMGGRMASLVAEELGLQKLAFLGYPLHPPGKRDQLRDEHLYGLGSRMLFISGTRDSLCDLTLLRKVLRKLPKAELLVIENGDHSLKVPKRSEQSAADVFETVVSRLVGFAQS